jgi:hypothetical protein
MTDLTSPPGTVVRLELDLGSFELGTDECRELIRRLDHRAASPGGAHAGELARRLASLLESGATTLPGGIEEEELDALADAAWDWLERDGSEGFPERVILLLDVVRARHAHE